MVNEMGIGHSSKCGGIPMYPDESIYCDMKSRLDKNQLDTYKRLVEEYYGKYGMGFPWDNE